jgi:hypothetical protein
VICNPEPVFAGEAEATDDADAARGVAAGFREPVAFATVAVFDAEVRGRLALAPAELVTLRSAAAVARFTVSFSFVPAVAAAAVAFEVAAPYSSAAWPHATSHAANDQSDIPATRKMRRNSRCHFIL